MSTEQTEQTVSQAEQTVSQAESSIADFTREMVAHLTPKEREVLRTRFAGNEKALEMLTEPAVAPAEAETVDALPDTESAPARPHTPAFFTPESILDQTAAASAAQKAVALREGATAVDLDASPAMPGEQCQLMHRFDQAVELVDIEVSVGRVIRIIAGTARVNVDAGQSVAEAIAADGGVVMNPGGSGGVYAVIIVLNDTDTTSAIGGKLFVRSVSGKAVQPKAAVNPAKLAGFDPKDDLSTAGAAVTRQSTNRRNMPAPPPRADGDNVRTVTQTRGASSVAVCLQRQEAKRLLEAARGGYPIQASELPGIERALRTALEFI